MPRGTSYAVMRQRQGTVWWERSGRLNIKAMCFTQICHSTITKASSACFFSWKCVHKLCLKNAPGTLRWTSRWLSKALELAIDCHRENAVVVEWIDPTMLCTNINRWSNPWILHSNWYSSLTTMIIHHSHPDLETSARRIAGAPMKIELLKITAAKIPPKMNMGRSNPRSQNYSPRVSFLTGTQNMDPWRSVFFWSLDLFYHFPFWFSQGVDGGYALRATRGQRLFCKSLPQSTGWMWMGNWWRN